MKKYALDRTAKLLDRFAGELKHIVDADDPDAIHDLRVSIRRFSRCLQVFSQFYPDGSWKRIRRRLSELMHAAGSVRDCDIALELLAQAGLGEESPAVRRIRASRARAGSALGEEVRRWRKRNHVGKWRKRLDLP